MTNRAKTNGSLKKLKIIGYSDEKFQKKVSGAEYTVLINPDSMKWEREIEYNKQQSLGSSASSQKYKVTPGYTLSFDLVIDCTGVVDSKRTNLPDEMKTLKKVIYNYNGKIHRPNFVVIHWGGSMTFHGVLTNFDTTYTLFKPDGTPLRAKISLKFSSYTAPAVAARQSGKQSPDMTHLIDVVEGDSLPHLSEKIWHSPAYYVQLAEFNGLNKFRKLEAGTTLIFPPLITGPA